MVSDLIKTFLTVKAFRAEVISKQVVAVLLLHELCFNSGEKQTFNSASSLTIVLAAIRQVSTLSRCESMPCE
jgi:hypothetical protein